MFLYMNIKNKGGIKRKMGELSQLENKLHEERFQRIEETLEKLNNAIDANNINVSEDIKKLTKDFNDLKEDYIATKNSIFETVNSLKEVPKAINNLEKTLIVLNNSIENNDKKTDKLGENFSKLEKRVTENEGKSKFDILEFLKSFISPLIVSGLIYVLLKFIQ